MEGEMSDDRELEPPVDFPNGTTAIVKVQRPPDNRGENLSWIVFSQGLRHFRTYKEDQMPIWLVENVDQAEAVCERRGS
jgi:hypothetical protein